MAEMPPQHCRDAGVHQDEPNRCLRECTTLIGQKHQRPTSSQLCLVSLPIAQNALASQWMTRSVRD
jgi:hypothetical protein